MQSTLRVNPGPAGQNGAVSLSQQTFHVHETRTTGSSLQGMRRSGTPGVHRAARTHRSQGRAASPSALPLAHHRGCKSSEAVHQRCTFGCYSGHQGALTSALPWAHQASRRSSATNNSTSRRKRISSNGSNSSTGISICIHSSSTRSGICSSSSHSGSSIRSSSSSTTTTTTTNTTTTTSSSINVLGANNKEEYRQYTARCSSGAQAQTASVLVEGEGADDVALRGGAADVAAGENAPGTAAAKVGGEEELTRSQLLWRAAKPPLYSVALIPLLVGASAAYLEHGTFSPGRFWSFLFHSVLVIAWLNLSNDAFDAETGVDKDKKESVVNITGSRTGVLVAAFACLALGLAGLLRGALAVGDLRIFQLLAAAITCGYVYQSPPFRLSYKGLGEPLCFVAFGPLATTAFYLYQASSPGAQAAVGPTALAASALVGATTALILFCSHFHQIESDQSVGKMSPLVRLGTARGAAVVQGVVAAVYAATLGLCLTRTLPLVCLDKTKIFMAKYFCNKLHIAFGLMLALGLALGRRFPLAL